MPSPAEVGRLRLRRPNHRLSPSSPPLSLPRLRAARPLQPQLRPRPRQTTDEEPSGGIFRRLWSDPPTLDPHLTSDTTSAGLVVEIFSGLVALNTDLQLVPDVAESWEINEDGTVYTFKIRDNAKFHDGRRVTADDFKWSMQRAAHPDTASPVADTYLNDIVGVEAVLEGETEDISGITVIDDSTLQIEIDAPKAYFLAKLTYPTAYVLDSENVISGGRTWTDTPNGTGPFRLKEYRIGERIILERNEHFYREHANVDSIAMNLAGGQSMAMYENDEIDITGVGLFDLDRVLDPSEPLNEELVVAPPDFSISYVGFNASMAPFDDPKFRQALNHAVDKELIANEVLSSLVEPAYGILPPGFPGYNADLTGLEYDPDLARQLSGGVCLRRPNHQAENRRHRTRNGRDNRPRPRSRDRNVEAGTGCRGGNPTGRVGDLPAGPGPAEVPGLCRTGMAGGLPRPAGLPGHPLPH